MAESKYQKNKKLLININNNLTVKNLKKIGENKKTYKALYVLCEKVESAIYNKNMDRAKKIVKEAYTKVNNSLLKRAISETEFTDFLNNKNKFLKFTRNLKGVVGALGGIVKYADFTEKMIIALKSLKKLHETTEKTKYNAKVTQLKQGRDDLIRSYQKMDVLLKFLDALNTYSPPGAKEMISMDIKVFKLAKKTILDMEKYCQKIEKAVKKDMGKLQKVIAKKSYFTSGQDALKFKNLDQYYKYRGK